MESTKPQELLRAIASSEIYVKSAATRQRFMPMLNSNIQAALANSGVPGTVRRHGHHGFEIEADELDAAGAAAATVFGIDRVDRVRMLSAPTLESLADHVAELCSPEVAGRTFAVRVRRSGKHDWRSKEAERVLGTALFDASAGVDLSNPDVTVRVHVEDTKAAVVAHSWQGPAGFPVGTQTPVLALLSGGIDSPVAAWMMMRRGCPLDMLHFQLECNQADHALAVGHELARKWGHGAAITLHVIDFEPVKKELSASAQPRLRQVLLKQLMTEAAHRVAQQLEIPLLVTGDSLGQVSSQTAANLAEIDKYANAPLLRPLLAHTKQEIIDRARQIGTYELSTRAREVCDLSDGHRVETAAATYRLRQGMRRLRTGLVDDALTTWESIPASEWFPGVPLHPVTAGA